MAAPPRARCTQPPSPKGPYCTPYSTCRLLPSASDPLPSPVNFDPPRPSTPTPLVRQRPPAPRIRASRRARRGGSGAAVPMAQWVKLHDQGQLSAQSMPGTGSTPLSGAGCCRRARRCRCGRSACTMRSKMSTSSQCFVWGKRSTGQAPLSRNGALVPRGSHSTLADAMRDPPLGSRADCTTRRSLDARHSPHAARERRSAPSQFAAGRQSQRLPQHRDFRHRLGCRHPRHHHAALAAHLRLSAAPCRWRLLLSRGLRRTCQHPSRSPLRLRAHRPPMRPITQCPPLALRHPRRERPVRRGGRSRRRHSKRREAAAGTRELRSRILRQQRSRSCPGACRRAE
eukprot:4449909-Prymnesium_polylepis.1